MHRPVATSSMRGLTQFISEIYAAPSPAAEERCVEREMAHIRAKMQSNPKLDGYQRKKYIAKLLFAHMQGHQVDISSLDAMTLVCSSKYSEKQMGYLTLMLLLPSHEGLDKACISMIRKDLQSLSDKNTCLALHVLAHTGSQVLGEYLAEDVLKILVSPTSSHYAQKKAAIALLRIVREKPASVDVAEWVHLLVPLLNSRHLGLAGCVASLVMELAQQQPQAYAPCYMPAVDQLYNIVIKDDCREDYYYHSVPVPWLQVKLLALLQKFPPPSDTKLLTRLQHLVHQILRPDHPLRPSADVQESNARYAIYFEAVRLAMHLGPGLVTVSRAAVQLGQLLSWKETNLRYLALEVLTQLAHGLTSLDPIRLHTDTIFLSLEDQDISVRRRALDLVYALCDENNIQVMVSRLLPHLRTADLSLRQDMSLKITLLAEMVGSRTHAALALLDIAGDRAPDELWYRVVQVVTNQPKVHAPAARRIMTSLTHTECSDTLLKLSTYILGEYGYLIADHVETSPRVQFEYLQAHAHACSPSTLAMMLSTFAKWTNVYPELEEHLLDVLDVHRTSLDIELQQRALEYTMLAELAAEGSVPINEVLDELPAFHLSMLSPHAQAPGLFRPSKRTSMQPVVATVPRGEMRRMLPSKKPALRLTTALSSLSVPADVSSTMLATPRELSTVTANTADETELLDLHSMSLVSPTSDQPLVSSWISTDAPLPTPDGPLLTGESTSRASSTMLPPTSPASSLDDSEVFIDVPPDRLADARVTLYETAQERIVMTREHCGARVHVVIQITNLSASDAVIIQSFLVTAPIRSRVLDYASGVQVLPGRTTEYNVELFCNALFTGPVDVTVGLAHGPESAVPLRLRLPVRLTAFMDPTTMSTDDFFACWAYMKANEVQSVVSVDGRATAAYAALLRSLQFAVLDGVDPRVENVVAAAALNTHDDRIGVLLRWEPHSASTQARLTVRATSLDAAQAVHGVVGPLLAASPRADLK